MLNSTPHHESHRWTIDDISNKLLDAQEYPCFTSSAFTLSTSASASTPPQFELKLYPKGVKDDSKNFLSVGLFSTSFDGQRKCLLRCQFSLIDSEGQKCNTKELSHCFSSAESCSVFEQFITKSNLLNPENGFVHDGKLTIDCQITILGEPSSVGYFDSYLPDLHSIAKSNPNLTMELYHDLALKHQRNEFPDCVPIDLPFQVLLEETLTHHTKFSLCFESRNSKCCIFCLKKNSTFHTHSFEADTKPTLEFCIHWDEYGFTIFYRPLPTIFVDISVTCSEFFPDLKRKKFIQTYHFSRELSRHTNKIKTFFEWPIKNLEISLKMAIYKGCSRKFDFPELKSLSREQTLADLKFAIDCGKHCDVTLFVDGKQFCASKAILTALSFLFNLKMKIENQISLSDDVTSAQVFEHFLHYFYTGKVPTQITIEAIFELLNFSERYSKYVQLSQICIKFIVDHCLEVIDKEDYLKIFAKFTPKLMMEILDNLAQQYRLNEFPDFVPLDLTVDRSLEETVTHHAKSKLTFESTNKKLVKESFRKFQDFSELKSLSREQILLDLKSMLEGGKHCNVVLLVESKQFRAHKSILVNRSMLFEAMFPYGCKENVENRIEIHDVKVVAFEQFLLYLYTGKVDSEIMKIHLMDLFVLADMHYLSTLQEMCLRVFGQSLTPESAYEQFKLTDRLGLIEFKQVCTDYISKTNFSFPSTFREALISFL